MLIIMSTVTMHQRRREAIYNNANIVKESEHEKHMVFDGWKIRFKQTCLLSMEIQVLKC